METKMLLKLMVPMGDPPMLTLRANPITKALKTRDVTLPRLAWFPATTISGFIETSWLG
jgi:hypothetical protein